MIFASLIAKLGFDTSQWTAGKSKAISDLGAMDEKAKGFLKTMQDVSAKGGGFKEVFSEKFLGGGSFRDLSKELRDITELSDKIRELTVENDRFSRNAEDRIKGVLAAIPEWGKLYESLSKTIWYEEEEAINKANKALEYRVKMQDELSEKLKKYDTETKDAVKEFEKDASRQTTEARVASEPDETKRKILEAGQQWSQTIDDMREKADKIINQPRIDYLTKALADQKKAGNESRDEIKREQEELGRLLQDKIKIEKALADARVATSAHADMEIAKIKEDAAREDERKAQEAAKKELEIEKEKQRQIKDIAIKSLEDRRERLKDKIDDLSTKHDAVNVEQVRGGVGYVRSAVDPNTQILRESRDQLKAIDRSIQDLRSDKATSGDVNSSL